MDADQAGEQCILDALGNLRAVFAVGVSFGLFVGGRFVGGIGFFGSLVGVLVGGMGGDRRQGATP